MVFGVKISAIAIDYSGLEGACAAPFAMAEPNLQPSKDRVPAVRLSKGYHEISKAVTNSKIYKGIRKDFKKAMNLSPDEEDAAKEREIKEMKEDTRKYIKELQEKAVKEKKDWRREARKFEKMNLKRLAEQAVEDEARRIQPELNHDGQAISQISQKFEDIEIFRQQVRQVQTPNKLRQQQEILEKAFVSLQSQWNTPQIFKDGKHLPEFLKRISDHAEKWQAYAKLVPNAGNMPMFSKIKKIKIKKHAFPSIEKSALRDRKHSAPDAALPPLVSSSTGNGPMFSKIKIKPSAFHPIGGLPPIKGPLKGSKSVPDLGCNDVTNRLLAHVRVKEENLPPVQRKQVPSRKAANGMSVDGLVGQQLPWKLQPDVIQAHHANERWGIYQRKVFQNRPLAPIARR